MVMYPMITAEYFRNKFVKPVIERHRAEGKVEGKAEGKTEGKAEGKTEMYRRWAEWNSRRLQAESKGVPFDEPPPANER